MLRGGGRLWRFARLEEKRVHHTQEAAHHADDCGDGDQLAGKVQQPRADYRDEGDDDERAEHHHQALTKPARARRHLSGGRWASNHLAARLQKLCHDVQLKAAARTETRLVRGLSLTALWAEHLRGLSCETHHLNECLYINGRPVWSC